MVAIPSRLRDIDFSRVFFALRFEEDFRLELATFLQLRRELLTALQMFEMTDDTGDGDRLRKIFHPPAFADPVARRRFRIPSPGFVIRPPINLPRPITENSVLDMEVLFWGDARQQVGDFAAILDALGPFGLHCGAGRFQLSGVAVEAPGGERVALDISRTAGFLNIPFQDCAWWLDSLDLDGPLNFTILTPARLLKQGKPLFRPHFASLFPFLLRRVTSMSYAWCGCDLVEDPARLLETAAKVQVRRSTLAWKDWRSLEGDGGSQDLGGLLGEMELAGEELDKIAWVLALSTQLNLGRGAAFGGGRCSVIGDWG